MADDTSNDTATSENEDEKKGSGPLMGVLAFLMALGLGFGIGRFVQDDFAGPPVLDDDTRYDVQLRGDEPSRGPADALVTIIEFADYQCPYCAKAREPLEEALAKFDEDVRLLYKHFPLPSHRMALPAAKAAWAAHQQGKFWEMHAELFAANASVKNIGARAAALGMDEAAFLRDFGSPQAAKAVDDDMLAGAKLGVTGTPVFYVNGHRYVGYRDKGQWIEVLEYELDLAERMVDEGTPAGEVYAALMKDAVKQRRSRDPNPPSPPPAPGGLDPDVTYPVDVEDRPAMGPADALVTVAVFSDFQCPYCSRIAPSLHALLEVEHDVRVVSMQLPIPSHPQARDAAKAALAADRQGKYWEMHDALFESRDAVRSGDFVSIAEALDLDVAKFEADMADPQVEARIAADVALARELGVRSTPATFVNGHYVRGAVPLETLRQTVAAQRPMAQALVDAGTPKVGVYAAIMAEAVAPDP
ncbi:MAG: DsbA family protein [Nannocystaceae bacterium]|nr:thioredoxin domain-containing protein [bacterium]